MGQRIDVNHENIYYGDFLAVEDVNINIEANKVTAFIGPSGCGKSTLLSLISGLITPEKGLIKINGRSLRESAANIGYMLQHDQLFEWRTIYSNVLLGLEISRTLTPERKEKVGEMMETYGLKSFSNARPSELSGGMRQRAALIRTLAMEPDLLLLDEPFSAPDEAERL